MNCNSKHSPTIPAVVDPEPVTLPDQCLHSAEADVRSPRRKSGFDHCGPQVANRLPAICLDFSADARRSLYQARRGLVP
jgi:hypothetical protein